MEVENDVLFADLSKQIALLIMDDDDDDVLFPVQGPPVHAQGFHQWPQTIIPPQPYAYEIAYRRESKGTGVFIPRSSHPKRKNRAAAKSASNSSNSQRHNDRPGSVAAAPPHAANNSRLHSGYHASSGALKNRV